MNAFRDGSAQRAKAGAAQVLKAKGTPLGSINLRGSFTTKLPARGGAAPEPRRLLPTRMGRSDDVETGKIFRRHIKSPTQPNFCPSGT